MGKMDEGVLIARESGSQFGAELTYSSLSKIFPVVLLVNFILFLVMLFIYLEGSGILAIIFLIWTILTAATGLLAAFICVAGIEENNKRRHDAPSWLKVMLFGSFAIICFGALLMVVWFAIFAGFS